MPMANNLSDLYSDLRILSYEDFILTGLDNDKSTLGRIECVSVCALVFVYLCVRVSACVGVNELECCPCRFLVDSRSMFD